MFPNMKHTFTYLVILLALATSCSKYENSPMYDIEEENNLEEVTLVSSNSHNQMENDLFELINAYRESIGLNKMEFESTTFYYAGIHTDYMIKKGKTSHEKFGERAEKISKRTGAVYVAENVARKYDSIEEALEAWLESPGHRANIEGDYDFSAISIKPDSKGDLYFTQLFFR